MASQSAAAREVPQQSEAESLLLSPSLKQLPFLSVDHTAHGTWGQVACLWLDCYARHDAVYVSNSRRSMEREGMDE